MNLMIKMFKNEDLWELYADDLVITAENEEHLQKKVEAWQKYLDSARLKINVDKTQVTVSSKEVVMEQLYMMFEVQL